MSDSGQAVFLSYASQDAAAARRICEALRAAGVEVWFDQSELVGGDAWDAKIRKQIAECALFVPIISANTQARLEGYFRIEWKLAAQRTHAMAEAKPFLLPVVTDATRDAEAHVPGEFRAVQWTRLPGGETPAKFCAQVQRLLGGEIAGQAADRASDQRPDRQPGGRLARRRVPAAASFGALLAAAALLVLAFWQPWKQPALPPAAPGGAAASPTEAQKLVAQARRLYDEGDELDRENLLLAEDLVKRALASDGTEPSAWELGAMLSYTFVWHSIDLSTARKELLMRQATRAVALAPQSVAARVALANARLGVLFTGSWGSRTTELGEIERELQTLAGQEPGNWRVQRALATVYRFLDRTDDAIRAHRAAVELSHEHPMAVADLVNILLRRNRFAEAEPLVAAGLARQRSGRLLTFDQLLKVRWRGDLTAAQASLATWPGWLLQGDRGVFYAWQVWFLSGQPTAALAVAQALPRDYLRDHAFSGPRAVLTARAHEQAGNPEAAQADWRTVVQHADRELATSPEDSGATYWKAWALARLGDAAGARATGALLRQRSSTAGSIFFGATSIAPLWVTIGEIELAFDELQGRGVSQADTIRLTRALLKLDPAFGPLRNDPRFQAIVAAAPGPGS